MTAPTRAKQATQDRQAELVQAALRLAALHSPAEVTTGELAQAIGISQGGVFRHFESKEAIWLAVLDWAQRTLFDGLRLAMQQAEPDGPVPALRAVFMAHIGFVQQYPGVPRLIFQELQHARPTRLKERVQALMADYRHLLAGLLAQAQAEGHIAPEVDLPAAAILFLGAVQGLVMQSLLSGRLQDMGPQAQAVFELYQAGLWARPQPVQRKCI